MKYYLSVLYALFSIICGYNAYSQPEPPVIDYVTVNLATLKPEIYWNYGSPAQINGYAVKRFIRSFSSVPDNTWHTVEIISDPNTTQYEDISNIYGNALPYSRPEIYEITAYKISGTDTTYSLPSIKHSTVFLEGNYEYCNNEITIKWNNYTGWGTGFLKYEIYIKQENTGFVKISEKNYGDTVFKYQNTEYNTNYTFYIKAIRNDGIESLSNTATINTQSINFPEYLNVVNTEVSEKNNFRIKFITDTNSDTKKYKLFKKTTKDSRFKLYDQTDNINIQELVFEDTDFDPLNLNLYYITCEDYCGKNIFTSDTFSNIVLKTNPENEFPRKNNLSWEDIYDNGEYLIFRSENNADFYNIDQTTEHDYTDNIQNIYENQFFEPELSGEFCYYAILKNGNFTNKSNISCAKQKETYFLPNAFNPKSNNEKNRTFKPEIAFVKDYTLTIYGAYGDIIFESKNPAYGWDGKLKNGKLAPVSTYPYFLKFTNSEGKTIKIKKFVTLVY